MAPRPLASATITVGLVTVPVELFTSSERRDETSFHLISRKSGARVRQRFVDPTSNEVVPREELLRGYEVAKDQYVTFTPDELKALDEKATSEISIAEFVPAVAVPREYVDKVYWLGPTRAGQRAYRLLAATLEETGRSGIGQYAARGRQYLVMLRATGDGLLVLEQLHYPEELRPPAGINVGEGEVRANELALARQLVERATVDEFDPEKYQDTVRARVLDAIDRKLQGEDITKDPSRREEDRILDLMEALKASLGVMEAPQASADATQKLKTPDEHPRRRRRSA